jgi:hypothetical protein
MQWMPFWQSITASDHVAVKVILHTYMVHINFKKPSHGGEDGGCTNTHEISPMWQVEAIVHTNMHIGFEILSHHGRVGGAPQ